MAYYDKLVSLLSFVALLESARSQQYVRGTQSSSTTKRELLQPDTNDNAATSVSEIDLLQDGDFGIRGGYRISNPLPWFVIFQGRTLCSGSLIHGDIILTAAHCVDDNGIPPSVRVGSTDYFSGGTVVGVSGGEIYPEWTMGKPSDPDLAIVVLDQFLNNDIAILNFDSELPEPNHNTLFTMGHGLINDSQSSRTLQGADIPYIDDCSDVSRSYERFRHICTDSRNVATCGGDSGSPVMLGRDSNVQVGINSYSNGRCIGQTLDIYTRVSYYRNWIGEQVCKYSSRPPEYCLVDTATAIASESPSVAPTDTPSTTPSYSPSTTPSKPPSLAPSVNPSVSPSVTPFLSPINSPSDISSLNPSYSPSGQPIMNTSKTQTQDLIIQSSTSSEVPTPFPTYNSTDSPSIAPSSLPSTTPSSKPSRQPSISPSPQPSISPTGTPSLIRPSMRPTFSLSISTINKETTAVPSSAPTANRGGAGGILHGNGYGYGSLYSFSQDEASISTISNGNTEMEDLNNSLPSPSPSSTSGQEEDDKNGGIFHRISNVFDFLNPFN